MAAYLQRRAWDEREPSFILWALCKKRLELVTPKDVVARLNGVVTTGLTDLGVRRQIGELGMEIPPSEQQAPEALRTIQKAEIEKWWPIIKAANIKGE